MHGVVRLSWTYAMTERNSSRARSVARSAYSRRCCVICGIEQEAALTVAHLDHRPENNAPRNLAYLCWVHHRMYDAGLYPKEAILLLRAHWQTVGEPDYSTILGSARELSERAHKAWKSRGQRKTRSTIGGSERARKAWATRRRRNRAPTKK